VLEKHAFKPYPRPSCILMAAIARLGKGRGPLVSSPCGRRGLAGSHAALAGTPRCGRPSPAQRLLLTVRATSCHYVNICVHRVSGSEVHRDGPKLSQPLASSLFGDDEEANKWAAELFSQSPAQRAPPVAAQGQVKRRSEAARLGDCRTPTHELGHPKDFVTMCDAVHTTVTKHGISVRRGRIAAVVGRPIWTGRDERSGYTVSIVRILINPRSPETSRWATLEKRRFATVVDRLFPQSRRLPPIDALGLNRSAERHVQYWI
jgi:hypothetical protein